MRRQPTLFFLLVAGFLVLGQTLVRGQSDATPPEEPAEMTEVVPPVEPIPTVGTSSAVVTEEGVSQEGNVSLDFRDADIQNVLRILSYKSGINIVTGPEVTGLVTIKLKDVPWQRALEVILETYGYAYEKRGNIILVTTIENLKKRREDAAVLSEQEPLVTQTFILNYAKSSTIVESVEKMVTERGSVNYDDRTNTIIVRDVPRNVELVAEVIAKLDSTTPQVLIEAKVIETTLNNTENLGIDWQTKFAVSGTKRPNSFPFSRTSKAKYLGTDFPAPDPEVTKDNDYFTYGTIDFNQLQATLEFLHTRSDTNILSAPKIVTLDNQPARIVVGTEYPIPEYTYNEEQATLQVSGFTWKDIGVIFEVTPHVNNAGYVTLELKPQISAVVGEVPFDNIDLPLVSKEEAFTTVMVKDGETLVIAGLIKDQVTDVKKKTPFIGDIPLLGLMFQKTEKEVIKTDLLIFLTPHVVTPEEPVEQ